MEGKKRVRNKAARIDGILEASKKLIEDRGYENVTIRDIAGVAEVSIGLIYKYFPGGKPDIIREIGVSLIADLMGAGMPESIDYDDFPGFLRAFYGQNLTYIKANRRFLTALMVATVQDRSVFEGFEEIGEDQMASIVAFFSGFKGADLSGKEEPWLFISKWSDVTKSILLHHALYPTPFDSDEELIELVVRISLMMWDYKDPKE